MQKLNVAVIGSGIAGLSAAWLLSKSHNVTIFEKEDHIGGHSNTQIAETTNEAIPVDTGFIVYNEENYPNLTALFDHLDVQTSASNMSFSYSLDNGVYEYSGAGLPGLFAQRSNLVRLKHWGMLRDIQRFFSSAAHTINKYPQDTTLGTFLDQEKYGRTFCEDHILPMAAAIWSSPASDIRTFPARSFIDFYANHGLLKIKNRPQWRTVSGGSFEYVKQIVADGKFSVVTNCQIASVKRYSNSVLICDDSGNRSYFDQVVFACHGDVALRLLENPTSQEEKILGNFRYSDNKVVLHCDNRFMPIRRSLWSSWNYTKRSENAGKSKESSTAITYWMNLLQPLKTHTDLFVTVNPNDEICPSKRFYQTNCRHPLMDLNATSAQKHLWDLQGKNCSWYCGSYFGYGFHEDALQSGLAVAEELGGLKRPWKVNNDSGRIHRTTSTFLKAAE